MYPNLLSVCHCCMLSVDSHWPTEVVCQLPARPLTTPACCRDLQDSTFLSWLRSNSAWLLPYSAFCFLRDLFGTADHRLWGIIHSNPTEHIRRITSPSQSYHREILFLYWLQWHLHEQLLEAAIYARARRVVLKGDLPIGVAKCSADTWCHPNLFHMDVSVGSPPDAFDAKGQNWASQACCCSSLV